MEKLQITETKPQIHIGVIGHEEAVDRVLAVLRSFPSFSPVVAIADHEES